MENSRCLVLESYQFLSFTVSSSISAVFPRFYSQTSTISVEDHLNKKVLLQNIFKIT